MNFTVRILVTILIAFAITFIASKILIPILKKAKAGQHVRDDGPQTHLVKEGTPTMGGIAMLIGIIAASFVFSSGDLNDTLFRCRHRFGFYGDRFFRRWAQAV